MIYRSKDDKEHGTKIQLFMPHPNYRDKKDSVFVFDENVGVWFLKNEYDKIDIENDDISHVPYLSESQIEHFGMWKII